MVKGQGETTAAALAEARMIAGQRKWSIGPLLHFRDEGVEAEYASYSNAANSALLPVSAASMGSMFLVLALLLVIEGHGTRDEYLVSVGCVVLALIDLLFGVFNAKLHVYIAWARQPLEYWAALYLVSTIERYSVLSTNVVYLCFTCAALLWFLVPPRVPWLAGLGIHITASILPAVAVEALVRGHLSTYLSNSAPIFIPTAMICLYRVESELRAQFLDELATRTARQRRMQEETRTRALLQRSMPPFVLPEVVSWLETDRRVAISHSLPEVTITFVRTIKFSQRLQARDPVAMTAAFGALGLLVAGYETVLSQPQFASTIVKIKTTGDILLVVAGIQRAEAAAVYPSTDDLRAEPSGSVRFFRRRRS